MQVSPINNKTSVNFNGSYSKTDNGVPYYKTNSATKAGVVLSVPAVLMWAIRGMTNLEKDKEKSIKELKSLGFSDKSIEKMFVNSKNMRKIALPAGIIATAMTIGSGYIVDSIRNNEAKKTADYVKHAGVKRALRENPDMSLSYNNRPYKTSNAGLKWGALLGAVCGVVNNFLEAGGKKLKIGSLVSNVILFSLGGLAMGAISDSLTNSDAEKNS